MQKTCNRESYVLPQRKFIVPNLELFFGLPSKTNQKINTLKSSIIKIENVRHDYAIQEHNQSTVSNIKIHWKLTLCLLLAPMLHVFNLLLCLLKAIKVIAISCIMIIAVFHSLCLSAQTPRKDSGVNGLDQIIPLKVGDTVPDELWDMPIQVINELEDKKSIKLSDYSNKKLILLDFWATWCGSCIEKFGELQKIQQDYDGEVVIIGATEDVKTRVEKFFEKRGKNDYKLLTTFGSKLLASYFPHKMIPHYVWITADRKVAAITSGESVSLSSIKEFIQNGTTPASNKYDMDIQSPLFLSEHYPTQNPLMHYSILTKGSFRGYPQGSKFRYDNNSVIGRSFTNTSLLLMYEGIARALFEEMNDRYTGKRIVLSVKDQSLIQDGEYSFDFINPPARSSTLYSDMLKTLNSYSGYYGRIVPKERDCLTLVVTDSVRSRILISKGGKGKNTLFRHDRSELINQPIQNFIIRTEDLDFIKLPIWDITGIKYNVDIVFDQKITSLEALQIELAKYGLGLQQTVRSLNTFILTDNIGLDY